MKRIQIFRLTSVAAALSVGFWLPLRLLDFDLAPVWDIAFDLAISAVSVLNIYLHFEKTEQSWKNWRNWLHVGLLMDLICVTPFLLIEYALFQDGNPWLLFLNIMTTRHVWKIKEFLDEFDNLQPVVYRLVPLGLMMPLLVHLTASGWIALGSGTAGPDPDKVFEYIKALYWSFTTLTTVGYGDISAKTATQMLFTACVEIVGVGVFGFVLSNVASLLSRMDAAREHHMDSLDRIETYMKNHSIPAEMKSKVRSYYHYLWTQHRGYNDHTLLEDLPYKMKSEMFLHINKSIIEKVALFKGASPELLEDLMNELQPKIYIPGERVFRIDDPGDSMYFIHNGEVDILTRENKKIVTLSDGAFFGEMALITDSPRNATSRAVTYCDAYALSKESFQRVLLAYPEFRRQIEEVVKARQQPPPTKAA